MMAAAAFLVLAIGSVAALQWGRLIRFGGDDSVFSSLNVASALAPIVHGHLHRLEV